MRWAEDRVGAKRINQTYAWRTFLNSGVKIAGGSDAPVESENPFFGIYAAITRQDQKGWPEGGWHPEQRLNREEALKLFTIDAAFAAFEEDIKGSLKEGKLADMVIIDEDIMSIPASEIFKIKPVMTIVGGKIVYKAK
jgi:predicted amidohydrolase YtcJ